MNEKDVNIIDIPTDIGGLLAFQPKKKDRIKRKHKYSIKDIAKYMESTGKKFEEITEEELKQFILK